MNKLKKQTIMISLLLMPYFSFAEIGEICHSLKNRLMVKAEDTFRFIRKHPKTSLGIGASVIGLAAGIKLYPKLKQAYMSSDDKTKNKVKIVSAIGIGVLAIIAGTFKGYKALSSILGRQYFRPDIQKKAEGYVDQLRNIGAQEVDFLTKDYNNKFHLKQLYPY